MATIDPNARTDAPSVKEIIETNLTDETVIAFVNTAHRQVEDVLGSAGLSVATLTEIEKYLAAHFLTLKDPRAESEGYGGDYKIKVQGETGMGLEATFYGQMAISLDTSGLLASAGAGLKVARAVVHGSNDPDAWD